MNGAIMGLRANAQHRTDQALGTWTASGKGSRRVHTNYDGWTIRTNTRRTWTVHTPDGDQVGGELSALWVAKHDAERAIAEAPATTPTVLAVHNLPDHVAEHRIAMNEIRPELHALAIGGGAYGITSVTTTPDEAGRSITTITTEDGHSWPRPSGDGARVVLRSELHAL